MIASNTELAARKRQLEAKSQELAVTNTQMKRYTRALESANEALDKFNQIAESATRAKSEFLANMSHEIRTPITAILGYADLLLDDQLDKTTFEHASVIKRNGKHLLGVINDILDLSKVEAGQLQIEKTHCSPAKIVSEVISLMRVRAEEKSLTLESNLQALLPDDVLADPLRLRQILVNLVGNAIKFTDQGGVRIDVATFSREGMPYLQFEILDTGIGMSKEQIARLFKPFSQVDTSATRKFGGTGLGLCISKRLAEALGGGIEVESTPEKGSLFRITIQVGAVQKSHGAIGAGTLGGDEALAKIADATAFVQGSRILLAEDGLDNQRLIALLLKKAGAEVTVVENGKLALDQALEAKEQGHAFDVILMDMQMPVMDGYTATAELRRNDYHRPIIALTANAMQDDRAKCLDAGCDEYLSKPIDRTKMIATIGTVLQSVAEKSDA